MSAARVELAPGYAVSRLINGCWQLSAGHRPEPIAPERALDALVQLAEAGFTTFDGADIYTGVEARLGELVRRLRSTSTRPQVEIHTKLVPDLDELPTLRRERVEAIVDTSLRRLGVERLDLVQLHWWDFSIAGHVEAAQWLAALQREGKVRHVGVTNYDLPHLRELWDAGVPVLSNQVQYSLLDRRPERDLAAWCREHGVALLAYGTLAGGLLTERSLALEEPPPPADRSQVKYRLVIEEAGSWSALREALGAVRRVAEPTGASVAEAAVRWALERPAVAAAVLGVSGRPRLASRRRILRMPWRPEDGEAIDAAIERTGTVPGDVYGLERVPGGRHAAIMKTDLHRRHGA